ncbi:hypothetical protein [Kordia sp.]|uniref:hypothetical protein n=1 Tax=Kordia sp. TaxID=1965332 RepID=UPI003D267EC8
MKKILYIAICAVILGCSSMHTIHNKEKLREAISFAYVAPVFDTNTNTSSSKRIQSFKKYIHFGVDSLFTVDAKRYNISKKIPVSNANITNIENMFTADASEKLVLSNELLSYFQNSNEKHVMLLSFKPKLGSVFDRFETVKSSEMEVVIIETATGTLIFRDTFYTSNKGINKQLLQNIQQLFSKLKKVK